MALLDDIFVGTELKFALDITADGFDMDNDGWSVTVKGSLGSVRIDKSDCIDDGESNWFFTFDSTAVGPGQPVAIVTAYVPDNDFPDGLRTEVDKVNLPIYIRR